jgi:hypothetical protein
MIKIAFLPVFILISGCSSIPNSESHGIQRRTGDYARALKLSPAALKVLSSTASEALPENAPNDAVLIYLAKRSPEANRENSIASATAKALIMNSDLLCERYMADFILKSRVTSNGLRLGSLSLTTAAGVTTPVRSANLLSGIATFLSGSEEKLTQSVLGSKTPELLYRTVMSIRTRERTRLLTLLRSDVLAGESPSIVLGQIADYHNQCGPTVGINGLEQAVQDTANQAATTGQTRAASFIEPLK